MESLIKHLLNISLDLDFDTGFTFTSGLKSPIYCDNRLLYGDIEAREKVVAEFCDLIPTQNPSNTLIAGIATASIGWGAIVADKPQLPFAYVRPKAKEHGAQRTIEGASVQDKKTILI